MTGSILRLTLSILVFTFFIASTAESAGTKETTCLCSTCDDLFRRVMKRLRTRE